MAQHPPCLTELTPLCTLPCTIRFVIWCLRLARLSSADSPSAQERLLEVHTVLRVPDATTALQGFVRVLMRETGGTVDIREPGRRSAFPSIVELDLLAALGWLQIGETGRAQHMLRGHASAAALPALLRAATSWVTQLKEGGILLPYLHDPDAAAVAPGASGTSIH